MTKRLVVSLALFLVLSSIGNAATYNLTNTQRSILISWLYEQEGYLDHAVNNLGVSARQALALTPTLDVTVWIRTNVRGSGVDPDDWLGCSMAWWIVTHDQVNVTVATRPLETMEFLDLLGRWETSINEAFGRISEAARDGNSVPISDTSGAVVNTMPAGQHLRGQIQFIDKAQGVLQ